MQRVMLKKLATGLILILIGGVLALSADSYLGAQVKPKPGTFRDVLSQYVGQEIEKATGINQKQVLVISEVKNDCVILIKKIPEDLEGLFGKQPKKELIIPFSAITALEVRGGRLTDIEF